jgi:signal transduction histidine kinase
MQAHGPLQSAAAAAAARIDESADEAGLQDAWSQVRSDLVGALDVVRSGPRDRAGLREAVASLAATWDGVSKIDLDLAPGVSEALEADWVASSSAVEIVTELVGNSMIHGHASWVSISLWLEGSDRVWLKVADDGGMTQADDADGLGSRLLEDVTITWSRRGTETGVVVQACIAVVGTR